MQQESSMFCERLRTNPTERGIVRNTSLAVLVIWGCFGVVAAEAAAGDWDPPVSLARQIEEAQVSEAVSISSLEGLARVEKAARTKSLVNAMIKAETSRLAMRRSAKAMEAAQTSPGEPSTRRIEMAAYRDNDQHAGADSGVVTLLRRKVMRIEPPQAAVATGDRSFRPLVVSRPPTRMLESQGSRPETKIAVADEIGSADPIIDASLPAQGLLQSVVVDDAPATNDPGRRNDQAGEAMPTLDPGQVVSKIEMPIAAQIQRQDASVASQIMTESPIDAPKKETPRAEEEPGIAAVAVAAVRRQPVPDQRQEIVVEEAPQMVEATRDTETLPLVAEAPVPSVVVSKGAANAAAVSDAPAMESVVVAPPVIESAARPVETPIIQAPAKHATTEVATVPEPREVILQGPVQEPVAQVPSSVEPELPQTSVTVTVDPAPQATNAQQSLAASTPTPRQDPVAEPAKAVTANDASQPHVFAQASTPSPRLAMQWPFKLGMGKQTLPPPTIDQVASNNVSLSVVDVDVRTVFEMLAKGYGMNILVAPDVEGTVTANVSGLTPEQTLQSVVRMCNLATQTDDGVTLIYPADNLPREARQLRVFPLDFARADVVEATVQGLLSPMGSAYISKVDELDNRKNRESVVVVDIPAVIQQVEQYVLQIDQPPRQVLIEARVLEIELRDQMEHGVNFEALLGDVRIGAFNITDNISTSTNPFFFFEIDSTNLDAVLTLLETTTDAKTLATPRVMVVNGQNAKIQVGQQLGFAVATVTQTSTIQDVRYLETGVVLNVTPTISRDNRVLLQVKPKVSSGAVNPDTLLPEETTREVETSVMLDNHQGMIVGGLIQEEDRVVIKKMPWIGDFKLVGKLFQRRDTQRTRSEIIVALIPHIIEPGSGHYTCKDPCRDQDSWARTDSELFNGPLNRNCRPSEARLPDVTTDSWLFKDHRRQANINPYGKGCEPIKTRIIEHH